MKKNIFNSDEEDEKKDSNVELKINTKYAENYEKWRNKEELQKLKDRYGDVDLNEEYSEESSTNESEDEDAKEWNESMEKNFFKTLSLLKSKDNRIYDKDTVIFEQNSNETNENTANDKNSNKKKITKDKPFYLKDLEREMILKKINEETPENEENESKSEKFAKKSYYEEQDELKKSFKNVDIDDANEDGLFKIRTKTKEEKEKEEEEYRLWLKGHRNRISDQKLENDMKYLHDYWNDANLTENEKFLRDYILSKRYLDKDDTSDDDNNGEIMNYKINDEKSKKIDPENVDLSEDERIIEQMETFEKKYNFRFEEPDQEFIKSYPRTITDTLRRKENKRKLKREEYKKRKEAEKLKKKEEIKRMKNLKRKEIMEKINKIKQVTGNEDLELNVEDLDKDFDVMEHDKRMQKLFDAKFYQNCDDEKPVFSDSDPELQIEDYDGWVDEAIEDYEEDETLTNKKKKKKSKRNDEDENDTDFNMDCDAIDDTSAKQESKSNKKRGSKFSQAVSNQKPIFNPDEKTFEEYFDEYYKLDCEDIIGGEIPCRFKYREVVPNDFGLDVDEVLNADDKELNSWVPLKKAIQYRPIKDELFDVRAYKDKSKNVEKKKKILTSVFNTEKENHSDDETQMQQNESKKQKTKDNLPDKNANNEISNKPKQFEKTQISDTNGNKSKNAKNNNDEVTNKNPSSVKPNNKPKKMKKKKNKNVLESLSDKRLAAFGINPKKFKKKLKYSKNSNNSQ